MLQNGHHSSHHSTSTSLTTPTPPPTAIDPDEAARLAGYQPEQPEQLLEAEYRLVQEQEGGDTRPVQESPLPRIAAVTLPMGLLLLAGIGIWFGLLAPNSKKLPEVATVPTPVPTLSSDDSAELKSQLAFQQQQMNAEKPDPKSRQTPVKREDRREQKREVPQRITRTEPPEPRVVTRSSPARERSTPVVPRVVPATRMREVDPFARWNQLAQLGQQQTNEAGESQSANPDTPMSSDATTQQIVAAATVPGMIPTVRVGIDPLLESTPSATVDASTDAMLDVPGRNNSIRLASGQLIAPDINSTEQRILQERSLDREPMRVAIGTTVPAQVVVPILASQATEQGLGRFTVELTEDVLSTDGRVALPKGTLLVTEVSQVEKFTHRVEQSAVAIVYQDWAGNTVQQQLPTNSLLIRGANNQPLIAQSFEDGSGIVAGQDLLVGGLTALGQVGELLNQPDEESFSRFDGPLGNGQTFRRNRKPNIWGASLEGFFGVTADRLRKRADTITDEQYARPKVLVVQQGQSVSVVFNTFFEIQR